MTNEPRSPPQQDAAREIGELVRQRRFTKAARRYAEATGADAVEAKLAVDRLARRYGLLPLRGCASHFILLVGLAVVAGWALLG